jgi:tetratricopeptide (TPR) repeat protein
MNKLMRTLTIVYLLLTIIAPLFDQCHCQNAMDYFGQGYEAAMRRDWQSAEKLYSKSIEKDPQNAEVFLQRAIAREMMKRFDDASEDYRKALLLNPHCYLAWEYLGKLYESYGQYNNAIKCYEAALKLVDDSKWRGIVRKWISRARKLAKASEKEKREKRESRAKGSPSQLY